MVQSNGIQNSEGYPSPNGAQMILTIIGLFSSHLSTASSPWRRVRAASKSKAQIRSPWETNHVSYQALLAYHAIYQPVGIKYPMCTPKEETRNWGKTKKGWDSLQVKSFISTQKWNSNQPNVGSNSRVVRINHRGHSGPWGSRPYALRVWPRWLFQRYTPRISTIPMNLGIRWAPTWKALPNAAFMKAWKD